MNPSEKGPHKLKKYTLEKEITTSSIIDFYDDFNIGALSPSWKSEGLEVSKLNETFKFQVLIENLRGGIKFLIEISGQKFQGGCFS